MPLMNADSLEQSDREQPIKRNLRKSAFEIRVICVKAFDLRLHSQTSTKRNDRSAGLDSRRRGKDSAG